MRWRRCRSLGAAWRGQPRRLLGEGPANRRLLSHEVRPEAQPLVPDPAAAAGARRPVRVRRRRLHLRRGGPRLPQRPDCCGALRPCHQLLGLRGPAQEGGKEAPRGAPSGFTEGVEAGPGTQDQDQSALASTSCALSLGGGPPRLSQRVGRDPFPSSTPFWASSPWPPAAAVTLQYRGMEAFPLAPPR